MNLGNLPRKKYLIDGLQYRVLAVSFLYFCSIILVFAGILFLPLIIQLDSGAITSPVVQEAARSFLVLHTRLWTPVLLLVALLVVHIVVVSHRIVGPLYRIRNELKKIGGGNLFVHVKLRKNDYLYKEADSVNEMVEQLRDKIRSIEQNQKKANALLVDLQRAVIRGSADDVNDKIDRLGAVLGMLDDSVGQFQIPRELSRPSETPIRADGSAPEPKRDPVGAGVSQKP